MQVPIGKIQIKEGRRSLDAGHVKELAGSIQELGLLNDADYALRCGRDFINLKKVLNYKVNNDGSEGTS